MPTPHEIDPRATGDPRNVYPSDEQFYSSDRPAHAELPEDRPRGGRPPAPLKHRGTWATVGLVVGIILLVLLGIALFP
ncbi:hypothetical protein AAW14_22990 [Streptomyces hygroscopicus]|uniref:hypothetical protein n=1 Tax=Streptomyces hygroscopicus TaxID=1912 RepID=UPI0022400096|nr:hypothetical protein [Streptomyces hygroscopicus]MCW7944803.1 hypothetical protein [Streptomyces hygroscopicus]